MPRLYVAVFLVAGLILAGCRGELIEEEVEGTLVPLHKLKEHVAATKANDGLTAEYHTLREGQLKPWTVADKPANRDKHRYQTLKAYDETRVVLTPLPDDPDSDYINANWVDSYKRRRAFIATQGPLDETVPDFWRMAWQENVRVIIMAVNVWEHGKQKCAQYWPNDTDSYGPIQVTLKREQKYPFFTFRQLQVEKDGESRLVRHFHFTGWPDMGVPEYPLSLITLLNNAKNFQTDCSPIMIHCSAGVGRTGTFLLLNNAMEMAATEGKVDVHELLEKLRGQRVNVVETVPQYTLVYDTLVDVYFGQTPGANVTQAA